MDSSGASNNALVAAVTAVCVCLVAGIYFFKSSKKVSSEIGGSKKKDSLHMYPAGEMKIYFGSQTGTAEGFARVLMEEGKKKGFDAKTIDLEDFDADNLQDTQVAIFLMATYGEGEPTDNAAKFVRWLKNEEGQTDDDCLKKLNYTVFGLGNKQYEHFNRMGKVTNTLLGKLGANKCYDYGEGDDDGSLEEDFDNWRNGMWPALLNQFHPNASTSTDTDSVGGSKVDLNFTTEIVSNSKSVAAIRTNQMSNSTKHFFTSQHAMIICNRELRNVATGGNDVGSTKHIEIDLNGLNLSYDTADNLAILPENDDVSVAKLCKILGYELDSLITVKPIDDSINNFKYPFPVPSSIKDILTKYYDIHGHVSRSIVSSLLAYVQDPAQVKWLQGMLAKDNKTAYKAYFEDGFVSVFDLITSQLTSLKIPFADLLHILKFMIPRYYTISSSSSVFPSSVHITVSVTEYRVATGKSFKGLCSNYLQKLGQNSDKCRIFIRPSTFKLPKSIATPIIMIGPGTGIAPMRALLQERQYQCNNKNGNSDNCKNILFFGCKNSNVDYIYKDELSDFVSKKTLTDFYVAFSREDKDKKVYVQHLMLHEGTGASLVKLIDSGAYIYVCGATAMGNDVHETIIKLLSTHNKVTKEHALETVKKLQNNGRYIQELWST